MDKKHTHGIALAVTAAALYALNAPFSKILLGYMPSALLAGFLYLGAGLGMLLLAAIRKGAKKTAERALTRAELPYITGMVVLDIAAPIFLMAGLNRTTAANASLLNNFEIVATAILARVCFGERISPRLRSGILFVTLSSALLSFEDISGLRFSAGSLFVLLAACCWGLENNCTRKLSSKDPLEIVLIKGIFSGTGSVLVGLLTGEKVTCPGSIPFILLLGFVAYGLSIYVYVYAQRELGAARTSAYYAAAPFIGAFLSLLIFREVPGATYLIALICMLLGAFLSASDEPIFSR